MFAPTIQLATIAPPARAEIRKPSRVKRSRISVTRVVVAGNIITATAYCAFYAYASGIFN